MAQPIAISDMPWEVLSPREKAAFYEGIPSGSPATLAVMKFDTASRTVARQMGHYHDCELSTGQCYLEHGSVAVMGKRYQTKSVKADKAIDSILDGLSGGEFHENETVMRLSDAYRALPKEDKEHKCCRSDLADAVLCKGECKLTWFQRLFFHQPTRGDLSQ